MKCLLPWTREREWAFLIGNWSIDWSWRLRQVWDFDKCGCLRCLEKKQWLFIVLEWLVEWQCQQQRQQKQRFLGIYGGF